MIILTNIHYVLPNRWSEQRMSIVMLYLPISIKNAYLIEEFEKSGKILVIKIYKITLM